MNRKLPAGSTYYSLASLISEDGKRTAYKINEWVCGYGSMPPDRLVQTPQGIVRVEYFPTMRAVQDALNPRSTKSHRLAKALIFGIAALAGYMDHLDLDTM